MKKIVLIISLIINLIACQPYKDVVIDPYAPRFVTYDQTRMYFKNVRASYYSAAKITQTKLSNDLNILIYNKAIQDSTQAVLQLHLVLNDKNENAYIMLAPNVFFEGYQHFKIFWKNKEAGLHNVIGYKQGGMSEQFYVATKIYNLLNQDDISFEIEIGNKKLPFLDTIEERNAFRVTMIDYYRLVTLL